MKRGVFVIGIVLTLLIVGMVIGIMPLNDLRGCSGDEDCVEVRGECCGCGAGGEATAINKNFKYSYEDNLTKTCKGACITVISQHPSCSPDMKPLCINYYCILSNKSKEINDKIDYSCKTDSDCEIKDVGNKCGSYPLCVNKDFIPDPPEFDSVICGYPQVDYCKCGDNKCAGFDKTNLISSECTDSDGGNNYYIYGEIRATVSLDVKYSVGDECIGNYSLREYYCNGLNITDEVFICPSGCKNGACVNYNCLKEGEYTSSGLEVNPSNKTCCESLEAIYDGWAIEDGKCLKGTDAPSICVNCGNGVCGTGENKCNCPADCVEKCEPIGLRKLGEYCSLDKNWVEQKVSNENCENNFECTSNVCVSGKCVDENLLQKIINWFKRLFGRK